MTVSWIEHRFAGGVLALDVANTVVLREDSERRFDRFENSAEIPRFAEAATHFRGGELQGRQLTVGDGATGKSKLVELREAIDRMFRDGVRQGHLSSAHLPDLLRACAGALEGSVEPVTMNGHGRASPPEIRFETAVALSALSLIPEAKRIRTCDNCGWLFLDRSRNGSRRWCDMTVCGNRQKARRHYRRRTADAE